jgi:hypothetical protein
MKKKKRKKNPFALELKHKWCVISYITKISIGTQYLRTTAINTASWTWLCGELF